MTQLLPHKIDVETRDDGTLILTSQYPVDPVVKNTGVWLHDWAEKTPEAIFLAEKSGDNWREISFAESLSTVRAMAQGLLDMGLKPGDRMMVLSGNSVDHGLIMLAAQYIGVIGVPVAEQYSLIPEARDRLLYIAEKTRPSALFVSDASLYGPAIADPAVAEIPVIASDPEGAPRIVTAVADLAAATPGNAVDAAYAEIGPDTLAKILFTSGSTSQPKGVCTTQRMMCVNQAQLAGCLPLLKAKPPKITDWLPWNHVFGGSHNFNMALANGGSMYIDDGKPVKGLFDKTLDSLRTHPGNLSFNVPVGWSLLVSAMKQDAGLRKAFFEQVEMLFYAGAALPQDIWDGLKELSIEERGEMPFMTSSWGMTETAPATLIVHEMIDKSGVIGVPVPGARIKLVPEDENRFELRVAGDNIMTAYFEDPGKTADAFDDEGFLITGDAVKFFQPNRREAGLLFDGRITEDFKLMTGTWVRAAALREKALLALGPLVQDVLVIGQSRSDIGVLVFPSAAQMREDWSRDGDLITESAYLDQIKTKLADLNSGAAGSSTRLARAVILADPPSVKDHEITAKGNLNVSRVLANRAAAVDRLYDDADAAIVKG